MKKNSVTIKQSGVITITNFNGRKSQTSYSTCLTIPSNSLLLILLINYSSLKLSETYPPKHFLETVIFTFFFYPQFDYSLSFDNFRSCFYPIGYCYYGYFVFTGFLVSPGFNILIILLIFLFSELICLNKKYIKDQEFKISLGIYLDLIIICKQGLVHL